jgi:hypothetical protein
MQQKLWDSGLQHGSVFLEFPNSRVDFHWDPGSVEGLQYLRYGAEVYSEYFHCLAIILLAQRKCGGYCWQSLLEMCQLKVNGKNLDCQVFACAQLPLSVGYWCDAFSYMWGSHWKTYWKICEAKMLKPWDPENLKCSLGCIVLRGHALYHDLNGYIILFADDCNP